MDSALARIAALATLVMAVVAVFAYLLPRDNADVKPSPVTDSRTVQPSQEAVQTSPPATDLAQATPAKEDALAPTWNYVSRMEFVSEDWMSEYGPAATAQLEGEFYPDSLIFHAFSNIEYHFDILVSKRCELLEGVVGIDDRSEDSITGLFAGIYADGERIFAEEIQYGSKVAIVADISDAIRLSFRFNGQRTNMNYNGGTQAAWGDLRVRCAGSLVEPVG